MSADRPLFDLTERIIGAALAVHTQLGPGLLESVYQRALCMELSNRGLAHRAEAPVRVRYDGVDLGLGHRADVIVEDAVILEIKAVERLELVHHRQLLSYLKASGLSVGLLLNFGAVHLRDGIVRVVST